MTRSAFVRQLLAGDDGALSDLEVRRPSLEETYMAMVQHHEAGRVDDAVAIAGFGGHAP